MMTYTPTVESHYVLNASDTDYPIRGALAFDKIATEFFGKEYHAQQVGDGRQHDKFSNDSVYEFVMSEDEVEEELQEYNGPQTYLGYDRAKKETVRHEGHNRLEYWKSLSWSKDPDKITHEHNPSEGEDCYGAVFSYDFQVYREAPDFRWTLAHLIKNGVLPYGKYLLYVSW